MTETPPATMKTHLHIKNNRALGAHMEQRLARQPEQQSSGDEKTGVKKRAWRQAPMT